MLLLKSAGEEVSLTLPAPGVANSPWASLDSDASLQALPLSSHGLLSSRVCVCVCVCVCVYKHIWIYDCASPEDILTNSRNFKSSCQREILEIIK